jgi:small-conductance mechanosensitive channel
MPPRVEDVVRFSPNFGLTLAALGVAAFVTLVAVRASSAPALARWQRWFNLVVVPSWALAVWLTGLRLLSSASAAELWAKSILLTALVVTAVPLTRDLLAGLAMAAEGRLRPGDDVRIEGHEGRLVRIGLRSITVRKPDRTEVTIPNHRCVTAVVERLDPAAKESPCELEIPLLPGQDLEATTRQLVEAAVLSPFAAPGRRPEVHPVADAHGTLRLRVRGWVFDRTHEAQFRGDVLSRAAKARN